MNFKQIGLKTKTHIKIMLLSIVMFASFYGKLMAQTDNKREKIEALRIAFITQKLDLNTKEALVFWPVYNEYLDKIETLRKNFKLQYTKNTNYDFKTDKEAENYINAEITLKQKEAEYFKEYYEKIKKTLPIKKVAQLRRAEEDFKKELLHQLQGKGTIE